MIQVRVNHVARVRAQLSQRPQRGLSFAGRRQVPQRVDDEAHDGVELRKDLFASRPGELAKRRKHRRRDGRVRVA